MRRKDAGEEVHEANERPPSRHVHATPISTARPSGLHSQTPTVSTLSGYALHLSRDGSEVDRAKHHAINALASSHLVGLRSRATLRGGLTTSIPHLGHASSPRLAGCERPLRPMALRGTLCLSSFLLLTDSPASAALHSLRQFLC